MTSRSDIQVELKIQEVNEDVSFIEKASIDTILLNNSKLHLNAKGSALLAYHFIQFLREEHYHKHGKQPLVNNPNKILGYRKT